MPEDETTVDLGEMIDHDKDLLSVELPDGSIQINLSGLATTPTGESKDHASNLAEHLDDGDLGLIAEELLRQIEDDQERQQQRLSDIDKGIELLGIKLEKPRSEPSEEGMSVIRHPLLLEAVMRFQANARGELLPADGPVKIRDDGEGSNAEDQQANKLAKDFNHYLTVVATEYYPDMDRMLFSLGFGGEAYKKVYFDPVKKRPVSQTIDRKDIILSDGAVSIEQCKRVTHSCLMAPSDVKRMMLLGTWRDIPLTNTSIADLTSTDQALANVSGVAPKTTLYPDEQDRRIYECYCELNLPGFEHKEKGKESGLALPYRVTLEKDTRQVLEIRRWWREDDEAFLRKPVFVEYVFVPAFPGVNLGLLHILGNASRALTAAWRIALDNGMLANFPGGIMARGSGRQQNTNIRVAPGQVAQVDVDSQLPLSQTFMPLPYRDVTAGFLGIVNEITQTAQRVGGTAETNTGEGRSDAPVGTTIALIEQATKVLSAVHKRMHQAQAKEFQMLKELFKDSPEALWRQNNKPNLPANANDVVAALNNCDIIPAADPNTASQMLRISKAVAIREMAMSNPDMYDMQEVDRRVMEMADIEDIERLFNKSPAPAPMVDPAKMASAQAQQMNAQAKMADVQAKAQKAQGDQQLQAQDSQTKAAETQVKAMQARTSASDSYFDNANRAADREAQLQLEQLKLAREQLIHGDEMQRDHVQHFTQLHQNNQQHALDLAHQHAQHQDQMAHQQQVHDDTMSLEQDRMAHEQALHKDDVAVKKQQLQGSRSAMGRLGRQRSLSQKK